MKTRSTVREREVFTSSFLASKIPFTVQVKLKGPIPWESQIRVMEEPSTTGSGDSGVMNGTGKAGGGGSGGKGKKGGEESQLRTCYITQFLTGRHSRGNTTYMLPLTHLIPIL